MQTSSGQTSTPGLDALLRDGTLAGQWVLDPGRSSIRLRSNVMGLIRVNGVFREISGTGTIRPDGAVSGTITVAAASIDTGKTQRDTHLRSADFFDSANYQQITFTAVGVCAEGNGAVITGALTVRGQTRPLRLGAAVSVRGDGEVGLDAAVRINRANFGLTWNVLGLASMNNTITIHAIFTRGDN